MTGPISVRKKPVEVQAMQWTGDNADALAAWTRNLFDALDESDRAASDDPDATAQVYDALHSTWVLVQPGDWIIRGIQGEFYPCRHEVFVETYEPLRGPDGQTPVVPITNWHKPRRGNDG